MVLPLQAHRAMMPHFPPCHETCCRLTSYQCWGIGIPLVDEEVDPFFGQPRHVFTFRGMEVNTSASWRPNLRKLSTIRYLNVQLVTLSILKPVHFEGIAMQHLEEKIAHFPLTTAVVPACGSNPHPHFVVRVQHGGKSIPDRTGQDFHQESQMDMHIVPGSSRALQRW